MKEGLEEVIECILPDLALAGESGESILHVPQQSPIAVTYILAIMTSNVRVSMFAHQI
jgi:hypothetical protein